MHAHTSSTPAKLCGGILRVKFKLRGVDLECGREVSEEEVRDKVVEGYPDIVVWAEDGVPDEGLCSAVLQLEDEHLCVRCMSVCVHESVCECTCAWCVK